MRKILSVKQAAKILGVSTNTMYKYLNEGRITATRGAGQGNFRIPLSSLENFLGTKIDSDALEEKTRPSIESVAPKHNHSKSHPSHLTLSTKIIRLGLITVLLILILETIVGQNFSLSTNLFRLLTLVLLFFLTYQQGGFNQNSKT